MKMENSISKYVLLLTAAWWFIRCDTRTNETIVTDIDGHIYRTVKIGNQTWMAENLRVTRYRNGDPIPNISDATSWRICTTGAYCNYNNDSTYVIPHGRLYNWYAINDNRSLAPAGWHIPRDEEIMALIHWLEEHSSDAEQIKTTGLSGYRFYTGVSYHTMGFNGYWWSTTSSFEMYNWSPRLFTGFADVQRNQYESNYGLSVRCIKD